MADPAAPELNAPPVAASEAPAVVPPVAPPNDASPPATPPNDPSPPAAPTAEAPPPAPERVPSLLESAKVPGEAPAEPSKPPEPPPAEVKPPEIEAKPGEEKPAEKPPEEVKPPAEVPKEPEKAPEVEAKPPEAEVKPPEPAKAEPLEYKFELPADMAIDDTRKAALFTALDTYRADPSNIQPLVDFHHAAIQEIAGQALKYQHDVFNETKSTWRKEVMADEQIGGNGHETAMGVVARMRDRFVSQHPRDSAGWEADQKALVQALDLTGAGDHPAILRFIHNVGVAFDEPPPPAPSVGGKPPPQPGGPNTGKSPLHDNPRSPGNTRQ